MAGLGRNCQSRPLMIALKLCCTALLRFEPFYDIENEGAFASAIEGERKTRPIAGIREQIYATSPLPHCSRSHEAQVIAFKTSLGGQSAHLCFTHRRDREELNMAPVFGADLAGRFVYAIEAGRSPNSGAEEGWRSLGLNQKSAPATSIRQDVARLKNLKA